jgi:hypothetical protein
MKPKRKALLPKEPDGEEYDIEAASYVRKRSDTRKCLRECCVGFWIGLCGCSVIFGVVMFSIWIAV